MILIFSFSSENAEKSSSTSGTVIEQLAHIVVKDYDDLPQPEKEKIIASYQFSIRKLAHFSLYTVLGALSFLSFISYNRLKLRLRIVLSAGFSLLYAISDEIHQIFIPGRAGQLRDICIDFSGSLLSIIILALLSRYIKRIYKIIRTV